MGIVTRRCVNIKYCEHKSSYRDTCCKSSGIYYSNLGRTVIKDNMTCIGSKCTIRSSLEFKIPTGGTGQSSTPLHQLASLDSLSDVTVDTEGYITYNGSAWEISSNSLERDHVRNQMLLKKLEEQIDSMMDELDDYN